jgi:uncharacterized protein (TIGR00269 family)
MVYQSNVMKCSICKGAAGIRLPHFNLKLCNDHFTQLIHQRIERAIKKFRMFRKGDRILVAISGGKDSVSMWHALRRLGYEPDALFVKMGEGESVERAGQVVEKNVRLTGGRLWIEDGTRYFGGALPSEVARRLRRPVCAVCGLIRRYATNRFAVEHGYDVVATGHNMTDEAAALLGNLLHWNEGYLERQWPLLPKMEGGFAARAKPLALNYEEDIRLYAQILGIEYIDESCPFGLDATSRIYKRVLLELEREQPGVIAAFYMGYLRRSGVKQLSVVLTPCRRCGTPTTGDVCAFCRVVERYEQLTR